jgi:hypothetical protein
LKRWYGGGGEELREEENKIEEIPTKKEDKTAEVIAHPQQMQLGIFPDMFLGNLSSWPTVIANRTQGSLDLGSTLISSPMTSPASSVVTVVNGILGEVEEDSENTLVDEVPALQVKARDKKNPRNPSHYQPLKTRAMTKNLDLWTMDSNTVEEAVSEEDEMDDQHEQDARQRVQNDFKKWQQRQRELDFREHGLSTAEQNLLGFVGNLANVQATASSYLPLNFDGFGETLSEGEEYLQKTERLAKHLNATSTPARRKEDWNSRDEEPTEDLRHTCNCTTQSSSNAATFGGCSLCAEDEDPPTNDGRGIWKK